MGKTRVMVVDDHEVVRAGLQKGLETVEDIDVVGEAEDGPGAIREAVRCMPDVVLMDVRLGEMDGVEVCRRIRNALPEAEVLMLTAFGDQQTVKAAVMAGANGYLLKNVRRDDLIKAIRASARHESLLDPAVTRAVLEQWRESDGREDPLVASLSDREREVLRLVAKGMTNREIAEALVIAEPTARNHVSRILDRLDLSRRSELAAFAVQHGLGDPKEPASQ